jgi:hypothetical protein
MATESDLMGVGLAWPAATKLGYTPVSYNGAGTTSGTATAIRSKMSKILGATSATGAILPVSSPGEFFWICCDHNSTASAVIYPPSGATITNASSITLAADKNMVAWQFTPTLWYHLILV